MEYALIPKIKYLVVPIKFVQILHQYTYFYQIIIVACKAYSLVYFTIW